MKNVLILLSFLLSNYCRANQVLIPYFSKWKYLADGSNQDTSWRKSNFNDTNWNEAYAQFGYGDGDETSIVDYGPNSSSKYITTYFRKKFTINNLSSYSSILLNVKRDDGFVAYINGQEVYRNNLPPPPTSIQYNSLASSATDDGNSVITITLPISYFTNGINSIAVEIHQADPTSSDITFDAELIGNQIGTSNLTRGPYLQVATPTSIIIRWRTNNASSSEVRLGSSLGNYSINQSNTSLTTEHILHIDNLQANTKYYYTVGEIGFVLQGDEENYFITSPSSTSNQPIRIWATGDFGSGNYSANQVRSAFYNYSNGTYTNSWIWLGDNAYDNGFDTNFSDNVFNYHYEHILKKTCIWPALGNHDYNDLGYQEASTLTTNFPYFNIITTPQNAESGGVASNSKKYYSYDIGNTHFISLDSYGSLNTVGSPMYIWLQSDLQANTKKWTIVYFHHPPYTKGSHDSDYEIELVDMRTNIIPLLETYKVDLVLSGHSHSYERSFLIRNHYGISETFSNANQVDSGSGSIYTPYLKTSQTNYIGTVYAVVGCSGQNIESMSSGFPHHAMYTSSVTIYGSMLIEINGDTLHAKLIDNNVQSPAIIDEFNIIKECSPFVSLSSLNNLCINDSSIELNNGLPIGGIYSGNGVNNNFFNPSISGAGIHSIFYIASDFYGCIDSATTDIIVHDLSPITTTNYSICDGDTILLEANPIGGIFSVSNPYSGPSTSYFYTYVDSNGCSEISSPSFITTNSCSKLNLKLFLQSYYRSNGEMTSTLFNQNQSSNNLIVDTITIVLHETISPYAIVDSAKAMLFSNGMATVKFPNKFGNYFLEIKHRNTISSWSANPISISSNSIYDFSLDANNVYGGNQQEVESGIWALFSGDFNQDHNIDLYDDLLLENDINAFNTGYFSTDMNGDGNVDLIDVPNLENNINAFIYAMHP